MEFFLWDSLTMWSWSSHLFPLIFSFLNSNLKILEPLVLNCIKIWIIWCHDLCIINAHASHIQSHCHQNHLRLLISVRTKTVVFSVQSFVLQTPKWPGPRASPWLPLLRIPWASWWSQTRKAHARLWAFASARVLATTAPHGVFFKSLQG